MRDILIVLYQFQNTNYGIRAKRELEDKEKTIVIYCTTGHRSKRAKEELIKMGYSKVYNLHNGTQNYNVYNLHNGDTKL